MVGVWVSGGCGYNVTSFSTHIFTSSIFSVCNSWTETIEGKQLHAVGYYGNLYTTAKQMHSLKPP